MKSTRVVFLLFFGLLLMMYSCNDKDTISTADQIAKENELIDQYIAENNLTGMVDTVGTDLKYVVTEEGNGEQPALTDLIFLNYSGRLLSTGEVFDQADSAIFRLSGLIAGWQLILPNIKAGSKVTMFIPSYYAYGSNSVGSIPANSTLIFEIELIDVLDQFELEQLNVEIYLKEHDLIAEQDTATQMKYVIVESGTGDYPTSTSLVNASYEGRFLNDYIFSRADSSDLNLSYLIEGWQILMPYVQEGGTIKMFIPSKYGYGSNTYGQIPGNSTLIFTVTLNEIIE